MYCGNVGNGREERVNGESSKRMILHSNFAEALQVSASRTLLLSPLVVKDHGMPFEFLQFHTMDATTKLETTSISDHAVLTSTGCIFPLR